MNKIYKVIWSKARNCYVAVSETANAHSKGAKRARAALLSAVLSIGIAASGSVFASEPASTSTNLGQYVAGAFSKDPKKSGFPANPSNEQEYEVTMNGEKITYVYDASTQNWVRQGYKLVARTYKTTDLANDSNMYDIVWTGAGNEPTNALSTVTSLQKASGTMTNMGEALEALTPSKIEGFTNGGGTKIDGTYSYIIVDSSWKNKVDSKNYSNGYTDLQGTTRPLGFITVDDNKGLSWDDDHQCYVFTNADGTKDMVNYHNTYVMDINGESKIGVFTKADGSLYTGNVYGKSNEILTTTKGADGNFYSYWGTMVTDQALTMSSYYVTQYKNDLDTLVENDNKLYRNDIRSVDMKNNGNNEATLSLYRNGSGSDGTLVDGQLTITRTENVGQDTQIQITGTYQDGTNRTDQTLTLNTGSRVSVATQAGTNVAETITVNGQSYKVSAKDTTLKQATSSTDTTGAVSWTITDTDGNSVTLNDLASNTALSNLKTEVTTNISKLDDVAVKYDRNDEDDTVNYNSVTMGGTAYKDADHSGGTTITNVAYSTGNKSDAVNVQYLEDKIAASKGEMTAAEKHIKEGSYAVKTDNTVHMEQVNGDGTKTGEVIIEDVAKASELGKLNSTDETHVDGKNDGILKESLKNKDEEGNVTQTTMADVANKLDDKIDGVDKKVDTLSKNVESYQTNTNKEITTIKEQIAKAEANHTALTVNDGEAATEEYGQKGNLQLKETKTEAGKVTYDVKLSDKVTLGTGENTVTLDGEKGEASISNKLNVGGEDGVTIEKQENLGTYTADVKDQEGTEHKKGDTMTGYSAGGLANTTIHYDKFADGSGKAATEEQMKETLGDMDFNATIKNQAGETVNKYNIVNTATNVTEAVYQLDQNLTEVNARIDDNTTNIQKISGSLGKLNTRVNRVGAGAAALAALHPLDFDPDDKWDFAAGYGNYAGANATAIGAYYRPNEDTMLSVAGSFGGGENMVNAGVSLKLGRGDQVTTSKVAMAKEIKELRATVAAQGEQIVAQGEQIAALTALVEQLTSEKVVAPEAPAHAETFTVDTVEEEDGQPVIERVRTVKGA